MQSRENKIKILPDNLTNKIAAGEVVDRPASVVKELLENSIDAGADEITVIIKEGGKELIQVVDNGSGMAQEDLLLAFQRHATSKIYSYDDLLNISSLGFRGEALASIASVSHVEAKSVPQGQVSGHLLRIEGGVMNEVESIGGSAGTSFAVKHLFYNTPARRKFLRTTNTEYRKILNVATRFLLSYHDIAFTFVNEGELVYDLKREPLEERIGSVLGQRVLKNLIPVENDSYIKITGFIGNQDVFRRTRGDQFMYYNRRYFVNKNLNYAVVAGYGDIIGRGHYPVYILFIEMDARQVDVNVHPTKMEIKFANEQLVFSSIRGSVKRGLATTEVIPEIVPWSDSNAGQSPSISAHQKEIDFSREEHTFPGWPQRQTTDDEKRATELPQQDNLPIQKKNISFERINVWQVHNRYIISQIKSGLIVIDQHVAHERILYEKALRNFETRKPSPQQLLFPRVVELNVENYSHLLEMLPFLERIGFIIKAFGKNTVNIEAVPSGVKISDDEKTLLSILDEYKRGKRENTEIRENVAKSFACHSAIRSGDSLSLAEMNALIDNLFSTNEPYFCPHGRPTIVHIPLEELDRRFKRL